MKTLFKLNRSLLLIIFSISYVSLSAQISGPTSVCANILYEYYITSGEDYQWSATGGTISGADDESLVAITWNSSGFSGKKVTLTYDTDETSATSYSTINYNVTRTGTLTIHTVTGGGSYCNGAGGLPVGLDGSDSGTSYQLKKNGSNVGSAVSGTGSAISFGNKTSPGTYTVYSTGSCVGPMDGSAEIVKLNTGTFDVTGGGTYCSGGSAVAIGLSDSQSAATYQLVKDGTNTGSPVSGTGGAISFTSQTTAGTFTVVATKAGCTRTMTGNAVVTAGSTPTQYTVTGGGTYCPSESGLDVGLSDSQSGVTYQLKKNGINVGSTVSGTGNALDFGNQSNPGTYTVEATQTSSGCSQTMTGSQGIVAGSLPNARPLSGGGEYCVGGSGVDIGVIGTESSATYQLQLNGTNIEEPVAGNASNISFGNQTTAGVYTVTGTYGDGCVETMIGSKTVTISYPTSITSFALTTGQDFAQLNRAYGVLTVTGVGNRQWQSAPDTLAFTDIPNASADTLAFGVSSTTFFRVRLANTCDTVYSDYEKIEVKTFSTNSTTTLLQAVSNEQSIPTSGYGSITTQNYNDGLGRSVKSVSLGVTPAHTDVINFSNYDMTSSTYRSYLPYVSNDSIDNDFFSDELPLAQADFYTNASDIANSAYPFAEVETDASPLGRVEKRGGVGEDWQLANGHTMDYDGRTNTANEVRYWEEDAYSDSFYDAQSLWVSEMIDENGNESVSFTDKSGKTILTRRELGSGWIETGYIYDELGRLRYTISPEGMDLVASSGTVTLSASFLDDWAYQYEYDERGRAVEKKVPGKAAEYFVYDDWNRLILSQDGLLRLNNQWNFIKYDQRQRPVYTGLYTNTTQTTRAAMQTVVAALDYASTDLHYEATKDTTTGYTNQAFPTDNSEALSYIYYDDYDLDEDGTTDYSYTTSGLSPEPVPFSRVRGMTTATKTKILGTDDWLTSVIFYDKRGRAIQSRSDNHLGGYDLNTTEYDFPGRATRTKRVHYGLDTVTMVNRFVYDHASRLLTSHLQIDGGTEMEVSQLSYNQLGQMIEKNVGDSLQSLDYAYNIRGWMTGINNAATDDGENDQFGMELLYNEQDASLQNTEYFNGNISAIKWNDMDGQTIDQRAYSFSYDKLDRLTAADQQVHTSSWASSNGLKVSNLEYDANGNIMGISRKDPLAASMDSLTYTYSGNQLMSVTDAASSDGFVDGNTSGDDYAYDVNGNMAMDKNKDIDTIRYNHLNKPEAIILSSGSADSLTYQYTAGGVKLNMVAWGAGDTLNSVKYLGAYVYKNDTLHSIAHSEGRLLVESSGYDYHYFLTDHQGNTRRVVKNNNGTAEVLQANDYYPFGMQANTYANSYNTDYLYNAGSEMNEVTANYETFYRQYDAEIGRFTGIDIYASSFASMTPYQYGANDPIHNNDPMGDLVKPHDGYQEINSQYGFGRTDGMGIGGGGSGFSFFNPAAARNNWLESRGNAVSFGMSQGGPFGGGAGAYGSSGIGPSAQQYYGRKAWEERRALAMAHLQSFANAIASAAGLGTTKLTQSNVSTVYNVWKSLSNGESFTFFYDSDQAHLQVNRTTASANPSAGLELITLPGSSHDQIHSGYYKNDGGLRSASVELGIPFENLAKWNRVDAFQAENMAKNNVLENQTSLGKYIIVSEKEYDYNKSIFDTARTTATTAGFQKGMIWGGTLMAGLSIITGDPRLGSGVAIVTIGLFTAEGYYISSSRTKWNNLVDQNAIRIE